MVVPNLADTQEALNDRQRKYRDLSIIAGSGLDSVEAKRAGLAYVAPDNWSWRGHCQIYVHLSCEKGAGCGRTTPRHVDPRRGGWGLVKSNPKNGHPPNPKP